MRVNIAAAAMVAAAYLAAVLGGWDIGLQTLVLFMGIDYITGLIVAAVFRKSKKSTGGGLSSKCSFQGLARKVMQLLFVLIAYRLDTLIGTDFVRSAVLIAFISNELISISENAALMGLPLPDKIHKAIDVISGGTQR